MTESLSRQARARVGQTARKWHLDRLLDVGGMAAVYEATHRNGNRVAIKVLHAQYAALRDAKERFLREGYAANRVGHEGAVTVLDDDELDDGTPFIVMELLDGQPLATRLRARGRVSPTEILFVVDRVLDVLAAAHDHDVIHRDIKPPNIFLTAAGGVKVLDFGLARVLEKEDRYTLTRTGTILGTASFMSPEQARGKRNLIDHRTDIYATGAVMFRALSGRNIHLQDNPMDRLFATMTEPAPSLAEVTEGLPTDLVALVDGALAYDKHARFPDARTMQTELRRVYERLAGRPIPARYDVSEAAGWALDDGAVEAEEDLHVSVVYSDPGTGDSIVVEVEDDTGARAHRELRGTEESLGEVTIVDIDD